MTSAPTVAASTADRTAVVIVDRLTGRALRVAAVVLGAMTILGVIGFALSFENVADAARPSFGDRLAPLVPLGVDLGILVFSATGLLLAYLSMPSRWLRLVPAGLTGVTIWLNVDGERTAFGVVAHTVLPLLWVVAVGVAEHVVKHRLKIDIGRRMDQVRLARWLLAPRATFLLWRRMVLWEELSYTGALDRERQRLEFGARLRDGFGWRWRWRAPRRVRVLYRLERYVDAEVALLASVLWTPTDQRDVSTNNGRTRSDRSDDREADRSDRSDRSGRTPDRTGSRTDRTGRSDRTGQTGRTGRTAAGRTARRPRTVDELYDQVVALVQSGKLPDRPSAEAVRGALRCSADKARQVQRRYVAASTADAVDAVDEDSLDDD